MVGSEQKGGGKPFKILSKGILTLPVWGIFIFLYSPEAGGEANAGGTDFTSWSLSASHISGLAPSFSMWKAHDDGGIVLNLYS